MANIDENLTDEELDEEIENELDDEIQQEDEEQEADEQQTEESDPTQTLQEELEAQKDAYLRLRAEYDNFRKRTAKERLEIADTVKSNVLTEILGVIDNFERAMSAPCSDDEYKKGINMINDKFYSILKNLGVEEINPEGEEFDPSIANAISQVEDEELGANVVTQVFQKGYRIGDKIVRYAMVSVANP